MLFNTTCYDLHQEKRRTHVLPSSLLLIIPPDADLTGDHLLRLPHPPFNFLQLLLSHDYDLFYLFECKRLHTLNIKNNNSCQKGLYYLLLDYDFESRQDFTLFYSL